MLSNAQEKLIRSLQTNKGREKTGLCLVEGEKIIRMAGELIDFSFSENDSANFSKLVTTVTPQMQAAVARAPEFKMKSIQSKNIILVLDGLQDPGNVGIILRLCFGFHASVILIDSVDPTNPKVIRSSAGAVFRTPWIRVKREDADTVLQSVERPAYRLEKRSGAKELHLFHPTTPFTLVIGSEGQGIQMNTQNAGSLFIQHDPSLESLNVASAVAIALYTLSTDFS